MNKKDDDSYMMENAIDEARVTDDPASREDVFRHIAETFGLRIYDYEANFLGLLNRKWIIRTDEGRLFVKCYHPKRYNLSESGRRSRIEQSLRLQHALHQHAGYSPAVRSMNGESVHRTPAGHYYVLMQHVDGLPDKPGLIGESRMYSLGQVTGTMHELFLRLLPAGQSWQLDMEEMNTKQQLNLSIAVAQNPRNERVLSAIEKQGRLLAGLDAGMFHLLPEGWAHWDYWVDNIVFGAEDAAGNQVSITDFDTVRYSYPAVDIGRMLLSGCLHEDELRSGAAAAFLAGYRERSTLLPQGRKLVPLALKLIWCREAHWWLKGKANPRSIPPTRFCEELVWLTEKWEQLDDMFGGW
jgi:homoserine kinase type II